MPYGHLHSGNIMVDTTSNGTWALETIYEEEEVFPISRKSLIKGRHFPRKIIEIDLLYAQVITFTIIRGITFKERMIRV